MPYENPNVTWWQDRLLYLLNSGKSYRMFIARDIPGIVGFLDCSVTPSQLPLRYMELDKHIMSCQNIEKMVSGVCCGGK